MKRILYAAVMVMGCSLVIAAQSGMADKSKAKDAMAKDAPKTVSATGCVAESDGHFMLHDATTADQTTPMSYELSGGTLKPHVGHKVEITGTVKPMDKGAMKKDAMSKDKMADMKKDMATAGTLTVKSLKMIAATCP